MIRIIFTFMAVFCLCCTQISEAKTHIPVPQAPATQPESASSTVGQQGVVLGQPTPTEMAEFQAKQARLLEEARARELALEAEKQALFEESLEHMMPLNKEQIQQYREHADQRDRALLPVVPALQSRTVRVNLESGAKPIRVHTTANISTSLVFHDSTGAPWAITSVTNGSPALFQVLRPQLPEGNLLNVTPSQDYGVSTINVTLEKQDIPLVIMLVADSVRAPQRQADALVLFQLAGRGPNAPTPMLEQMRETVTSPMLAFLDLVPPKGAQRIQSNASSENFKAWKLHDVLYIRTKHMLMWPAWTAVANGAGNVKCYELPLSSRVLISEQGHIKTVLLKNAFVQGQRHE